MEKIGKDKVIRSQKSKVKARGVRHAQLVDTNIESDIEEAPSEAEESQPLGSRVSLMSEEFEASEPSCARTISSHSLVSLDSTVPLSPDHPLTHVSPTLTPTRVLFHRRTVRMVVRTQPTLSPGMSAQIAEAAALSPFSFCKRYRSSYETSSSSSPNLPAWKRYREDEDPGMEEEEAAPEGQQQAVLEIAPSTYEVGQSSRSVPEQEGAERTPSSPEWLLGSLPVSSSSPVVPSPIASPVATSVATISVDEDQFLERAAPWHAIFDIQRENHDLRRQLAVERRERLELTDHVARMDKRQESGGE
nr:hypothetical protein [Tanacetum cinerariifolium]